MRIACIFIPLFPLAARLRSEPELTPEAVALMEGNGTAARVAMATRRARRQGIRPGLTLAQARAILPGLIARGRDSECERAAQETLLEVAERFSPRVEDGGDGFAWIDIDGVERHFRSSSNDPERELALTLIRASEAAGLPARAGIASSKLAARIAAELPHSPHIVAAGEETSFLAPLPLARLSPQMKIASTLSRWGLESIGQLASITEAEIASRLGEAGRLLHAAARGVDPEPLLPRQPPPDFREGMDLEWPIVTLEPFVFVANAALDRLVRRMSSHGFACRRLELSLRLDPEGHHDRGIDLPAPTRDVKTLLTLMRLDLEQNPPGAPIAGFTIIAETDQPREGQLALFGPPSLAHDKVMTTVAKIASIVGRDRVGVPSQVDSHIPSRAHTQPFDPPAAPLVRREPRRSRGLLTVRAIRPELPLEVITTADGGRPLTIRSLESIEPSPRAQVGAAATRRRLLDGDVRVASGPWRVEEGWWTDGPIARDYWDIEMMKGGLWRIYHDRCSGEWKADATFD